MKKVDSKIEIPVKTSKSFFKKISDSWILFLLPALLVYLFFMAIPLINSMRLSFYTGVGLMPDHFVALKNYIDLFTNPYWRDRFLNALGNTCIFFAIHMLVQNILGLFFAHILSTSLKGSSVFRTIIFIPATLSVLVSGFLWLLILNPTWGAVNLLLGSVGLGGSVHAWLGNSRTALVVISLVSSWQWVGLPTMMFLAGMQGIPSELYEAASIDQASNFQIFWRIKMPLLFPVIGLVSVLTFVGNFNAFDVIYAMASSRGNPDYSTDILGTFFYRTAIAGEHPIAKPDMGIGASVATVMFFILFVGVMLWLYMTREKNAENSK